MLEPTWQNLIIWSVVLALAFFLLGGLLKLLKRFIKVWFFILVILVCLKLAADAGWIAL